MDEKETTNNRSAVEICKAAVPVFILIVAGTYILINPDISVNTLLSYAPSNPTLAAGVLILMYAVKSATVFFPIVVLEIATGYLFPTAEALLINSSGMLLVLTIPYWIGCFSGMGTVSKLVKKYPRFGYIIAHQQSNSFFLCFFMRIAGHLPGDIVTMYFGATKTPYLKNLCGGMLGILPRMILATVLGSSVQDPSSPAFWISVLLTALLSVISAIIYFLYRRRLINRREHCKEEAE
ncbi:MAG: TVP38/TMEM64 family protein [Oscillospiraceae bacterium]